MPTPAALLRLCLLAAAAALAGCASAPKLPPSEPIALPDASAIVVEPLPEAPLDAVPTVAATAGSDIVLRALGYIGIRYRFGGTTPDSGFDCSGFVRWVFRDQLPGELPRAAQDMSRVDAPSVEPGRLQAGDLVFFRIRGGRVSHVGIYIGDERFVHAPSRGGKVRIDRLDDHYWQRRFAGAKRVLRSG